MKRRLEFILAIFLLPASPAFAEFHCDHPVDPKKVVLFMGFHGKGVEWDGVLKGACARGETVMAAPPIDDLFERLKADYEGAVRKELAMNTPYSKAFVTCQLSGQKSPTCAQVKKMAPQFMALTKDRQAKSERLEAWKADAELVSPANQLEGALRQIRGIGGTVSSLVISGHDGGGKFYGEYGKILTSEIYAIARKNPDLLGGVRSVSLLGCWSAVPREIEEWRAGLPGLRLIAGFDGSSPGLGQKASGDYVAQVLSMEKKFDEANTMENAREAIKGIVGINNVTSALWFLPRCAAEPFYYTSPAEGEVQVQMRGLTVYAPEKNPDVALGKCLAVFTDATVAAVSAYFRGEKEPENSEDLKGLYSRYRNNENCFDNTGFHSEYSPQQVFFSALLPGHEKEHQSLFRRKFCFCLCGFGKTIRALAPGAEGRPGCEALHGGGARPPSLWGQPPENEP
jgi:hypothetical protein